MSQWIDSPGVRECVFSTGATLKFGARHGRRARIFYYSLGGAGLFEKDFN